MSKSETFPKWHKKVAQGHHGIRLSEPEGKQVRRYALCDGRSGSLSHDFSAPQAHLGVYVRPSVLLISAANTSFKPLSRRCLYNSVWSRAIVLITFADEATTPPRLLWALHVIAFDSLSHAAWWRYHCQVSISICIEDDTAQESVRYQHLHVHDTIKWYSSTFAELPFDADYMVVIQRPVTERCPVYRKWCRSPCKSGEPNATQTVNSAVGNCYLKQFSSFITWALFSTFNRLKSSNTRFFCRLGFSLFTSNRHTAYCNWSVSSLLQESQQPWSCGPKETLYWTSGRSPACGLCYIVHIPHSCQWHGIYVLCGARKKKQR